MSDPVRDTRTLDVTGCARCHGDGHPGLTFEPLTHPVVVGDQEMTHWAPCPTNGEPILLGATTAPIVHARYTPS